MQIKVHPLFFVLALILIAFGQALNFACTFLALILHETAHALMARARGFVVKRVVLLPFGAMMSVEERFDRTSSVAVGLAGPVANLLVALLTLGVWWLFPAVYSLTLPFLYANLSLGLFNLLPVYPLDGSRVALGLCKNRMRAVKGLQIAGIVVSVALFALFITSAFFKFNFTLGIVAVFLFYGAAFGTKEEMYVGILDNASKNYALGVQQKRVRVLGATPIVRLYHHISSACETVFEVLDEGGKTLAVLDEAGLKRIAVKRKLSTPIGECLDKMG